MSRSGQCLGGCHRWETLGRNVGCLVRFPVVPVLVRPMGLGRWRLCSLPASQAWEPHQALPLYRSPRAAKGPENAPPSCHLLFSRLNNLISFHFPSSVTFPGPRSLSHPPGPAPSHSHPPWEAGPGAGAVPERCLLPSPSAAHRPPCRQGTRAACPRPRALLPSSSTTANTHPR